MDFVIVHTTFANLFKKLFNGTNFFREPTRTSLVYFRFITAQALKKREISLFLFKKRVQTSEPTLTKKTLFRGKYSIFFPTDGATKCELV